MAEFTEDEAKLLLDSFRRLKLKPHADTPEDLASWLKSYAASNVEGEVKEEIDREESKNVEGEVKEDRDRKESKKVQPKASDLAVAIHPPRLSVFTGEKPVGKGDTNYEMWRYEVKCLLSEKIHSVESIFQAVRRSLRGEAGMIAMRLGPAANLEELLQKLHSVYGIVERRQSLLAKFYSARQRENEDVSAWSCRLENILVQAIQEGETDFERSNEMLREMFWIGLQQHLKDISGHKFDTIDDFDSLRVAIRQLEYSISDRNEECSIFRDKKHVHAKMAQSENTDMKELKGMIQKLSTDVATLQQKVFTNNQPEKHSQHPRDRREVKSSEGDVLRDQRWQHSNRGDFRMSRQPYSSDVNKPYHSVKANRQNYSDATDDLPVCYRCGQTGHIRLGCRVKLDHSRRALNFRPPMGRGAP